MIGDAIVCWRTWILYNRDWRVLVFPALCITGGFGEHLDFLLNLALPRPMSVHHTHHAPPAINVWRAKEIEAVIRVTAVDANADIRKTARKIFDAYKILLPGRVLRCVLYLKPRTYGCASDCIVASPTP